MNIETHLANNYDSKIQNYAKAEQEKEPGNTSSVRSLVDISGLKVGAVFKGEILDIAGDKVTIELENQARLQARLQQGIELGVGDRLLFSVKENLNSQILLKPMFDSLYSAQTQTLEKVLDAAGLSPTERNFSVAKELMDAGMPVDKASLVKILSQSMKFEGASMQTLVALHKMNIPVTEGNIAQYERYLNGSHQLANDIIASAESIADFASAMPEGTSAGKMLALTAEILEIFTAERKETVGFAENNQNNQIETGQVGQQEITDGNVLLPNSRTVSDGGRENMDAGQNLQMKNEVGNVHTEALEIVENLQETSVEKESERGIQNQQAEKFGLNNESLQDLNRTLQKAGISQGETRTILQTANSPEELLKQITQTLLNNGADAATVHAVVASNTFKKMLSDLVKSNWSMDPKVMKNPKEIDELYDKIVKQSRAFGEALSAKGGDSRQFQQSSQNMRQNMSFMEQINNQMIYAQMPLKLSNQNTNSELYVYADKRKIAEKKDGISVMLHLDMDHLGMTDIKVTLTGTSVNARFYLNDQQSVDIMADNMFMLAEQLRERGFSLTNEVIKRQPQESINKVVDEIIDENAERSIKRYTFDVKM